MKKCIIITGVTSGVGEEIALRFIQKLDWKVIGLARNKEKLKILEKSLGANFKGIVCDLQSSQEVVKGFSEIKRLSCHIDILVNNAAVFKLEEFNNCCMADIDRIIDTNLKGVMYTTLEALNIMNNDNSTRGSRIVNIASVASLHGMPGQSIYCASKFGLNGFAEALNQEIIKNNISITTIYPGGINTPLWNSDNPYPAGNVNETLDTTDIVDLIEYISNLQPKVILKNMTLFPSNEWH